MSSGQSAPVEQARRTQSVRFILGNGPLGRLAADARFDRSGVNPRGDDDFTIRDRRSEMDWLWTWGGECFGYRRNDRLLAYYGLQVGRFHGDEVYGSDGRYLGELKSWHRL